MHGFCLASRRVDPQPAGGDFGPEVTIGEQHATRVSGRLRDAEC
jgi:hypothetical protein